MYSKVMILFFSRLLQVVYLIEINEINVPPEHLGYVFNMFPSLADSCNVDSDCQYQKSNGKFFCWGYEFDCNKNSSYHVRPRCPGDHKGWVKTKEAQYDTFYTQADFGKLFIKLFMFFLSNMRHTFMNLLL